MLRQLPSGLKFLVMPDQKLLYPYKLQSAMVMGYGYLFGSLLLVTGETMAGFILMLPHIAQAAVANTPSTLNAPVKINQALLGMCFDIMLLGGLVMVTGCELNINTPGSGAQKVEAKKKKKRKN